MRERKKNETETEKTLGEKNEKRGEEEEEE